MMSYWRALILCGVCCVLTLHASIASAQDARGVVVDQTGLPLPGVLLEVRGNATVLRTITTDSDGTFDLSTVSGDVVTARLDGFEPVTVPRVEAARIVLPIARATESTEVIGSAVVPTEPTGNLLGSSLTASTVARMPSARLKARESLPLLPSIVRGPDGLMQIGGVRAHDAPLLLDGFNVTDPATGTSSLNLPFEAMQGIAVMRDPMAATYGGSLGGSVELQSRPGTDALKVGVQGVIPRPRFATPGFGRLEGIFPRVYASGSALSRGRLRYMVAAEYDYERIPVPGVTSGRGPDIVEQSATVFGRADFQATVQDSIVLEAFAFPSSTRSLGLSPMRTDGAAPNVGAHDSFGGFTLRHQFTSPAVLTVRVGYFQRQTTLTPEGIGLSYLSPNGWTGNSFANVHRRSARQSFQVALDRSLQSTTGTHDVTMTGSVRFRSLDGNVSEQPVFVSDDAGALVRSLEFGPGSQLEASDRLADAAVRDVWTVNDRVQLDGGARVDGSNRHGALPSVRTGVRVALDRTGRTVVKAGIGRFVGILPLAAQAFGRFPRRVDRIWEPSTSTVVSETAYQPTVNRLKLPRATTATVEIDRQLPFGIDGQVGMTTRTSNHVARLDVPTDGGALAVSSEGTGSYRELQFSAHRAFSKDQQVFVSYVRSSARGELNDFSAVFQELDRAILRPGGTSRLASDVRHRVIGWGTFDLPSRMVVSPVLEWRSGFPYSVLNDRQQYVGAPNSRQFPAFMALDMIVYRTFTVKRRSADLGIQLFNTTHHFNPRDVYQVAGSSRFGTFTNSVGTILRGFMLIKW